MHQDIKKDFVLLRILPPAMHPYILLARLDRPVGIWLLLLPSLWALALVANGYGFDFGAVVLFGVGAVIMRSAGCVVNDLWDRNLDKEVERTRGRPLAAGDVSICGALVFLCALLALGLLVLLKFNLVTILLGLLVVPLIVAYPLMKRVTWWPQAFLGLVFNFGALMGWSAAAGVVSLQALFLYVAGVLWTLAYDTIYAHQDLEDDAVIGVKSTARLFGDRSAFYVRTFYAGSFGFACLAVQGFGFVLLIPAGVYAARLLQNWQPSDPQSCLRVFQQSRNYGLLLLVGFIIIALF